MKNITKLMFSALLALGLSTSAYSFEGFSIGAIYSQTDFDAKEFSEIVTYKGFWKLVQKHTNEGVKEIIRSFSKTAFVKSLQQLIPEITINDVVSCEAGVRAQALKNNGSLVDDFLIIQNKNSLHVCNAPSPAATASLEIGKYIVNQISEQG